MFVELPLDDGIVRIENIHRVNYGEIANCEDDIHYDEDGPDTHYMLIHYKTHDGYKLYEYTYPNSEHMYNAVSSFSHRLGMYT